ncbi:MAG: M28 family peptidase [Bacteroidota bacterium]
MHRSLSPGIASTILLSAFLSSSTFSQARISEERIAAKVSQSRLQGTVKDLVKIGNRLGGTKSGDRSAKFVLEKFRESGLKADLLQDPEKLTFTNDRWLIRVEKPKRLRGLIQNEWLAGFSPSVKEKTVRLRTLKSSDEIDKGSLDSTAVLVGFNVIQKKYRELAEAGVRCILTYETVNSPAYTNWAMITSLASATDNPIPLFNISRTSGNRLWEEIGKGREIVIRFSTKTTVRPGRPKTVMATIKGKSEDYYIVCAHGDSDSGGPGADDNASGVSGVLEVARVLQESIRSKALPVPQKSVRFIVWGSEYFSTENYVKTHEEELGKIQGVINYDEIGTGKTRNCLYFEGNDISANEPMLRVFNAIGERYVGKKGFWKEATTNPSQGGTDSYVFLSDYLRKLNVPNAEIPSVTVYTAAWNEPRSMPQTSGWQSKAWKGHRDSVVIDYSAYYHSSLDIPSLTTEKEPFNMVWGVKAVAIALLRLGW